MGAHQQIMIESTCSYHHSYCQYYNVNLSYNQNSKGFEYYHGYSHPYHGNLHPYSCPVPCTYHFDSTNTGLYLVSTTMDVSRNSKHKGHATGGKKRAWRKKRKYKPGRRPANSKLSSCKTVSRVRLQGVGGIDDQLQVAALFDKHVKQDRLLKPSYEHSDAVTEDEFEGSRDVTAVPAGIRELEMTYNLICYEYEAHLFWIDGDGEVLEEEDVKMGVEDANDETADMMSDESLQRNEEPLSKGKYFVEGSKRLVNADEQVNGGSEVMKEEKNSEDDQVLEGIPQRNSTSLLSDIHLLSSSSLYCVTSFQSDL